MVDTTANTTKDIRSVIKNATRGASLGLSNKGVAGKGNTIATKEEINKDKTAETPKVSKTVSTANSGNIGASVGPKMGAIGGSVENPSSVVKQNENKGDEIQGGVNMSAVMGTDDVNKINDSGNSVSSVKINGVNPVGNRIGEGTRLQRGVVEEGNQKIAQQKHQMELGTAVGDLYTSVNTRLKEKGLYATVSDVRQAFPEFDNLDDSVVEQMISDCTYLSKQGSSDTQNILSLIGAYGLDANLTYEQLDDMTKGEYLAYLASGEGDEGTGWLDYIANVFGNQSLYMGDNAKLSDWLEVFSGEAEKAIISAEEAEGALAADYANVMAKYRGQKDKNENVFNEDWNKASLKNIANRGQNTLMSLLSNSAGIYNFFNNLLTVDTKDGVSVSSPSLKGLGQLGMGALSYGYQRAMGDEKYEEKVKEYEEIQRIGEQAEANLGWSGKFMNSMIKNREMVDTLVESYIIPHYKDAETFRDAVFEDPVAVVDDFLMFLEAGFRVGSKFGIGGKTKLLDDAGNVVLDSKGMPKMVNKLDLIADDVSKLSILNLEGAALGKVGELGLKGVGGATKVALKTVGGVSKGLVKGGSILVENLVNKMTGLTKEERDFIRKEPDLVNDFIMGRKTQEDLIAEIQAKYDENAADKLITGELFGKLAENGNLISTVEGLGKIDEVFKGLAGTKIKNGVLDFDKLSYTDKGKKLLQSAYEVIEGLRSKGDNATVNDVWRARKLIQDMIDFDKRSGGVEGEVESKLQTVRSELGDMLKKQVPGWEEADKAYTEIMRTIKDFKDWFNKDGTLKDNAYSKINNLTSRANKNRLERLKKYFPDIERDAKALAVANSVEKGMRATAGQYLQPALIRGTLGGILTGGSFSLAGVLKGIIASAVFTPKNIVKFLEYEGKMNKRIGELVDNFKKKGELSYKEEEELADILKENPEYYRSEVEYLTKKGILENIESSKADLEKRYKKGEISKKEYEDGMEELGYDKAITEATYKREGNMGATEREVSAEEKARLEEKYVGKIKDLKFVEDVKGKLESGVRGYTLLKEKLYKFAENPTNTTYQHEFFHAVFNVVDEKTRSYVLDEAKKILKDKGISDINAEERLAESFGEYARRQDVKLGVLDSEKGLSKIRAKIKDLFQKAYEWLQGYNGDRDTINKMFDELLRDDIKLSDKKIDLSYLLGDEGGKLGGEGGVPVKNSKTPTNGGGMGLKKYKKDGNGDNLQYNRKNANGLSKVLDNNQKADGLIKEKGMSVKGAGTEDIQGLSKKAKGMTTYDQGGVGQKDSRKAWNDSGRITEKDGGFLRAETDGEKVVKTLEKIKNNQPDGFKMDIHSAEDYNKWKTFLSNDGKSGFAVKDDGDITSVISEPGLGRGKNILLSAIQNGGNKLDCYDDFLPGFYKKGGFEPVARVKFNAEYAPADWKGKGQDIIVMMRRDNASVEEVADNWGKYEWDGEYQEVLDKLPVMEYDEALAYRDRLLEERSVRYKRVYHGSQADFDKFDSSHMGEGEGAQAHGWGHYVAVNKGTAKSYGEAGAGGTEFKGMPIDKFFKSSEGEKYSKVEEEAIRKVGEYMPTYTAEEAINVLPDDLYPGKTSFDKAVIRAIQNLSPDDFTPGRNLYDVEIPDPIKKDTPTGSNYLEEDGKLTEKQWNKFRDAIDKIDDSEKTIRGGTNIDEYYPGQTNFHSLYRQLSEVLGSDKKASKFLESMGYDGIHYYGKADGEAYVIFNDDKLNIKDHIRYKKDVINKLFNADLTSRTPESVVKDVVPELEQLYKDYPTPASKAYGEGYAEYVVNRTIYRKHKGLTDKFNSNMQKYADKVNSQTLANYIERKGGALSKDLKLSEADTMLAKQLSKAWEASDATLKQKGEIQEKFVNDPLYHIKGRNLANVIGVVSSPLYKGNIETSFKKEGNVIIATFNVGGRELPLHVYESELKQRGIDTKRLDIPSSKGLDKKGDTSVKDLARHYIINPLAMSNDLYKEW